MLDSIEWFLVFICIDLFFIIICLNDIRRYNNAVSVLWFVAAVVLEIMGVPFLFFEQNSPVFILLIFAVIILIIVMMVTYIKIEGKYKK